jgi:lantibiotic modifying enzyme
MARNAWQEWERSHRPLLDRASLKIVGCSFRRALKQRLERTSRHLALAQVFRARSKPGKAFTTRLDPCHLRQIVPGLAALWDAQTSNWKEFLNVFTTDLYSFAKIEGSRLTALETDLSDCHSGGRTATRVRLGENELWYYKPRSGRKERLWHELLEKLNSAGFEPPFLIPRFHLRGDHHWMQAVKHRAPRDVTSRRRLAHQAGTILYLAYVFRAVDLHPANFAIHDKYLVLVDCETLLHPETRLPARFRETEKGLFRTGMLAGGRNAPRFIAAIDASAGEIAEGFASIHAFLKRYGGKIGMQRWIARMRHEPVRLVLRPSIYYDRLLTRALERELVYGGSPCQILWEYISDGLTSDSRKRQEIGQLLAGDIPLFSGRAAATRFPLSEQDFRQCVDSLLVSGDEKVR